MAIGQLPRYHHWPGRKECALDVLATHAQEVPRRNAVGLVDAALVAALAECLLRQHCRRARARNQDGIRIRRHQLQYLPGHRRIGAPEALVAHHAQATDLGHLRKLAPPTFAVGIVEADEAHRLHALVGHVLGQDRRHQGVVLRHLECPAAACVAGRLDDRSRGGQRHHRRPALCNGVERGNRVWRDVGADDHIDLVLGDELAHVAHGSSRVSGVVEHDVLRALAAKRLRPHLHRVARRDADRGGGACGRQVDADADIGMGRPRGDTKRQHGHHWQQQLAQTHRRTPGRDRIVKRTTLGTASGTTTWLTSQPVATAT